MPNEMKIPDAHPLDATSSMATEAGFVDNSSGVSWSAVLAGAATAAALSLVLFILGVGLGLSSVSPWSYNTAPMGKSTIIWLAFSQLVGAGLGGYLAGRLRVKWSGVHTDEVYFRDTAHGFLAWAFATLVTAAFLAGAVRAVTSGAIDVGAAAGGAIMAKAGIAEDGAGADSIAYFTDMLLRSDQAAQASDQGPLHAEIMKIFAADLHAGRLSDEDKRYLSRQLVQHAGLTQPDADKRIDAVYARLTKTKDDAEAAAKEAADKARHFAAYSALWMFVALLLGAFFASLCATLGGRQRDNVIATSGHSG